MGTQWLERAAAALWGPFTALWVLGLGGVLLVCITPGLLCALPGILRGNASPREKRQGARVSSFVAMSTALGATMGTGNIVGVATALVSGGPGALLWMQLAALAGMALKFAEVALAVRYRALGAGPTGYLQRLGRFGRMLAAVFALCCVAASLGTGNVTQSNSAAAALGQLAVPRWLCALGFGLFTLAATGGGVRAVMLLSAVVVPVITVGYSALALAAVWQCRAALPQALQAVTAQAFGLQAAVGGAAGYTVRQAMRFGLARGIFSNEAGMGTSPIAHAESSAADPLRQGCWGIAEVFIDTTLSCTLTALVLLTAHGGTLPQQSGLTGAALAIAAFGAALGSAAGRWVAVFVALFGLTSVCGWYTYGVRCLQFLLPGRAGAQRGYRLLYAIGAALGALWGVREIWLLSDLLTGLMLLVNLCGLALLSGEVVKMVRAAGKKR